MIDELKQWEYDKGYTKGQIDILEKIKAEIRELSYNGEICTIDRYRVEEVINKHIKENKKCEI